MRAKAITASFVTVSLMSLFILILVAPFTVAGVGGWVGLAVGVGLTVLLSAIIWLISPWMMDLVNRWAYRCRDTSLEELGQYRPNVARFIHETCQRHGINVPRLKLIDDMNPTAYTYGSYANNARLVVTRGLLHYLDDEELKAVYAHELGHIIHRDFIVMTVASTLLAVLWQIYVATKNFKGRGKNGDAVAALAILAYVFWWVSQYLLLWLSRAREYYADEFAGGSTGNPNALSMALVKIAYGIARQPSTDFAKKLMGGTRALGIADPRAAGTTGYAYAAANGGGHAMAGALLGHQAADVAVTAEGIGRIEKVFLFDLFNPWASVLELGSTHPLTGKRIRALCAQAQSLRQGPLFQFAEVDAYGRQLDKGRLYGGFFLEVLVWFAPQFLAGAFLAVGFAGFALGNSGLGGFGMGGVLLGFGLGATLKGFFKFPALGEPQVISVLELMMDPYASPLRGRPVRVQGTVIGRADAGGRFGEDMMMEDTQGGLIALNYESLIPVFGNAWFGWKTVQGLVGQQVQAKGWFRRGISQQVDLEEMLTQGGERVSSWTGFWGRAGGVLILVLGLVVTVGAALAMTQADTGSSGPTSTSTLSPDPTQSP